ncbi:MAG: peptidoglycan DD-metalloendopeptidase family protein [Candidatus Fimenecus sp.]
MSERKKAEKGFKKLGKRTALLYAGLVIALCAAFAVAKNAAAFRLTPKAADETQTAVPSAKFDVSDLAPYTQSAETTAAPTEPAAPTQTQPDEQAVVAQEDGITRAEHFSLPLLSEVDKPFSGGDMVQSKTMGDWRVHNGVDFRGTVGDQVRAVNNGVVKAVYDDVLWGTVVEIDHGDGLVARYCGLGKGSTAAVGDKVKINDRIGNLGSVPVESADEVHLHFELRQDGTAVDPMPILES